MAEGRVDEGLSGREAVHHAQQNAQSELIACLSGVGVIRANSESFQAAATSQRLRSTTRVLRVLRKIIYKYNMIYIYIYIMFES